MIRKLAVVGVIVAGVVMLTAGAAFAHVEIERDGDVTAQGVVKATLSVPNESTTQGTKTIELVFPASPKLTEATAEPANGFTAAVKKSADGSVESITWTGGEITGDDEVSFPITLGDFPADTQTVEFKALQTYDNGDIVRWIEPTPASGEEPEHPAPVLYVKGEAPHDDDAADTGGAVTTQHNDSDSHDDSGMSTGAIVAIVLLVIIVIALIVFFVMRSRRGSKTPTS